MKFYMLIDHYPELEILLGIMLPTLIAFYLGMHTGETFLHASASQIGTILVVKKLKLMVKKPRKMQTKDTRNTYAFPSAHAAVSFALAVVVSFDISTLAPLMFAIAFIASYSRIKLNVHDWNDITGGAIIGIIIAMTTLVLI